jgi:glutaredoxin
VSTAARTHMIRLTLYGRRECHLCHEMRAVVEAVGREMDVELTEVDVDGDRALVRAYGNEVPVLCVNGERAFAGRVTAAALRTRLRREPQ